MESADGERERERERDPGKTGPRTFCAAQASAEWVRRSARIAGPKDGWGRAEPRGGLPPYRRGDSPLWEVEKVVVCFPFIGRFARLRAFPYVQTGLPTARGQEGGATAFV